MYFVQFYFIHAFSKMYVLSLLLISIITMRTVILAYQYTVNVGSVLFTPADVHKSHWTKPELSLIKARRHFQELLPPPSFIDTTTENYVQTLLKYFKDTYSTIKREAGCPASDHIMTAALSDAIGGYLKLWVLPITKLSFYGGTVSQDNILKLYKFHDEIKRYLGTDGKGWRSPDEILLKTITVNIATPKHLARNMNNPCQSLAYYERTDNGLSIPTPHIDWKDDTHTMFVPLRNQTLIPLDSPNYPNALVKYYDTAKNCIEASEKANRSEFDEKFQTWLNKDVLPHLSDENVYLPLGSVLTLIKRPDKDICEGIDNISYHNVKSSNSRYCIFGVPIDTTSKKTWIIGAILFLEISWCISALIYLACTKRKKKELIKIQTLHNACGNRRNRRDSKVFQGISFGKSKYPGFKISNHSTHSKQESPSFGSDSRGSIVTDTLFSSNRDSVISVMNEVKPPPLRSSMKKIRSSQTTSIQEIFSMKHSNSNKTCPLGKTTYIRKKYISQNSMNSNIKNPVPTELTMRPSSSRSDLSLKKIKGSSEDNLATISNTTYEKSSREHERKSLPTYHVTKPPLSGELAEHCPCLPCLGGDVGSEITIVNEKSCHREVCFDKNVEIHTRDKEPQQPPADKQNNKNLGLRLESGRPYLEIKIDNLPRTEISVGIGGIFDPLRGVKRSKIPKRLPMVTPAHVACASPARKVSTSSSTQQRKMKSLIPQPKKRPVDDIDVKPRKPALEDNKLNITL